MPLARHTFIASALYREPRESMQGFLRKRWSFWLALFSCVAFLVGNMVGQHGWSAFWKSVWGKEAEIAFTGAVYPLADLQPPLAPGDRSVVSVQHLGDYESGRSGEGSHPGADILAEAGTPVLAMMNGIVERVEERDWGFGNTVVLRHSDVPDPGRSDRRTTLYSSYAHLGAMFVQVGEIVRKGQRIALVGDTGLATTAHLHAQIDREKAPFHPYWPFTTTEAAERGLGFDEAVNGKLGQEQANRYTTDPLAYVETYRGWAENGEGLRGAREDEGARGESAPQNVARDRELHPAARLARYSPKEIWRLLRERMRTRRAERLARLREREVAPKKVASVSARPSLDGSVSLAPSDSPVPSEPETVARQAEVLAIASAPADQSRRGRASTDIPIPDLGGAVAAISMLHDGEFDRDWEQIVLFARDKEGNFLRTVRFEGALELVAIFGEADFSPAVLTEEQFDDRGRAFVRMLPRGRKTVVPAVRGAFIAEGEPMVSVPQATGNTVSTRASWQREG